MIQHKIPRPSKSDCWITPPKGELKLNFDAAFKEGKTTTTVELRNSDNILLGAWINHFSSDNPFCAEAEAAFQALRIATDLQLDRVIVEGDAQTVILVMQGVSQFEDWRAKKNIGQQVSNVGPKILLVFEFCSKTM